MSAMAVRVPPVASARYSNITRAMLLRYSSTSMQRAITRRQYRQYAVPIAGLGFTQQMYGPPRWYGVTLGYKW